MRSEQDLLVDCLQRLNHLRIPYMLVGSMASNYWGIPRSTHDLDFVVALQQTDVETFADAFEQGFFVQRQSIRSAFRPPYQFNAIDELSALKVDFWLLKEDAFEQTAFARREHVALFDTPATIMTAEDLILHKLYWHQLSPSDRQLSDVAGIYAVQGGALDTAYLRHWATQLGVAPELERLLSGKCLPKTT